MSSFAEAIIRELNVKSVPIHRYINKMIQTEEDYNIFKAKLYEYRELGHAIHKSLIEMGKERLENPTT